MKAKSDFLSRSVLPMVFGGLAVVGGVLAWGQVSEPQATPQRRGAIPPAQQNPPAANQPAANQLVDPAAQQRAQNRPATGDIRPQDSRAAQPGNQIGQRQRSGAQSQQSDAWLGVFLNENRDNTERGATVAQVYPSGPAARAGLQTGDVIQEINGKQIMTSHDLIAAIEPLQAGDKVELSVLRNDAQTKLNATLGSRSSFVFHEQNQGRYGGRGNEYDENDDFYNIPQHAMELEHNRRMAEQHQRIENEIAQLREEVRLLREALQKR